MKNAEYLYKLYLEFLNNKNSEKLDEFCRKHTNNLYTLEFGKGSTTAAWAQGLVLFVWQRVELSLVELLFHTENGVFSHYTFRNQTELPTVGAEAFLVKILEKSVDTSE